MTNMISDTLSLRDSLSRFRKVTVFSLQVLPPTKKQGLRTNFPIAPYKVTLNLSRDGRVIARLSP